MSYTETTATSWFARVKNALIGILVGILLLIGCCWLLIWNEGRAIQTRRALVEGAAQVVSIDSARTDQAYEGKLVHLTGPVTPDGTVRDDKFGIAVENAVGLSRQVEMYQWVEKSESKTEKKLGGGEETTTTYTYAKEWRSDLVRSSDFKKPDDHQNPDRMPDSATFSVETAHVGGFEVSGDSMADIGDRDALSLTDANLQSVADALATDKPVKRAEQGLFVGRDTASPAVGDLRIAFERIHVKEASLVGKQSGSRLIPYTTSNKRQIFLTASGQVDSEAMFQSAQSDNNIITWLVRAGGVIGLFIGFVCMFSILGVIGDLIPFVGSLVEFGTSFIAFVLTLILGPFVIAIGWLAYRPLLAIGLIAGGIILALLFVRLRKGKAAAVAA